MGEPYPLLSLLLSRAIILSSTAVPDTRERIPIRVGRWNDPHLQPGKQLLSVLLYPLHCRPDLFVRADQRGGLRAPQPLESGGRADSAVPLRGALRLLVRAPFLPRQPAIRRDDAL